MRLVRLKPQGPGPYQGPDRLVQVYNKNLQSSTTLGSEIAREKICFQASGLEGTIIQPCTRLRNKGPIGYKGMALHPQNCPLS